jgi:hypothetical protein
MSQALLRAVLAGAAVALVTTSFAPPAPEAPKLPVFAIATAEGKSLSVPVHELNADWTLRAGDPETRLAPGDWLSMRREGRKLPTFPTAQHLILVNGDRIPFESPRLDGETLYFKHPDLAEGKESRVRLTAVSVVWLAAPDTAEHSDQYLRRLAKGSRARDQVVLRNGDALEGVLSALTASKVEVEVDKKMVTVATEKVAAIALSTEIVTPLKPQASYARLVLLGERGNDGARLSVASATCTDGRTLEGKTLFGSNFRVPLERVAVLDVYQGRAIYLSDLKPTRFEFTPYLGEEGPVWPLVADANVAGRDLRLAGSTYDKGLGLHSKSRVTYNLAGAYRRFEAQVGLDDETGREGSVRVRVLADGKPLDIGADRELTARDRPISVGVSVAGVKELTLEVDFGEHGDRQDHVNWCDARLIK